MARPAARHARAWSAPTLEVYARGESGGVEEAVVFCGAEVVRAVPFDAVELGLGSL